MNKTVIAKVVAVVIIVSFVIGFLSTLQSLSVQPDSGKFIFENIGSASRFIAIMLIISLSSSQKDMFWFRRKKSIRLDERQLRERHTIIELSYKIGTLIVVAMTIFFMYRIQGLPDLIAHTTFNIVPGAFMSLFVYQIYALLALPPVIAALRAQPNLKAKAQ